MNAPHPVSDPPRVLGKAEQGQVVSSEEYATSEFEEPWIYERINGRLVVMAPEGYAGASATEFWLERLYLYKLSHRDLVQHIFPQAWIRVDPHTDCISDIAVYLVSNLTPPRPLPDRVPEIVFEIVSASGRDRKRDCQVKRAAYEKIGVREYVIVDRFRPGVVVLENTPSGFRERILTLQDHYETPLLPGFSVRLSEVLSA